MIAGKCKRIKYTGRSILFYHAWFSMIKVGLRSLFSHATTEYHLLYTNKKVNNIDFLVVHFEYCSMNLLPNGYTWGLSTFKKCCVRDRNRHMTVMVTPVQRKLFAIEIKSNITWWETLRENFHNEFDVLIRLCNVKYFLCHVSRFYTCTIIVLQKKPSMKFTTVKPINILFAKK